MKKGRLMERTPGKWKYKVNQREVEILDDNGSCVAFTHWTHDPHVLHDAEANAAYIVRAVNCHDRLVEAAKKAREWMVYASGVADDVRKQRISDIDTLVAEAEGGGNG